MPWSIAVPAAIGVGSSLLSNNQSQHAAANISNVPQNWATSYGSTNIGGVTSLDPSIRNNQNQLLAQYQQLFPLAGQYSQTAQGLYGNLLGQAGSNQGGFVQSSIAPTQQLIDQSYGALVQDQQNRGIRGSSLANDSISNFDFQAGNALQGATSQALQQSLGLQSGLVGNQFNAGLAGLSAQQGILGSENTINQQNLAQELASLGMDSTQTQILLNQMQMANQARAGGQAGIGSGLMGLSGLDWGSLLSSFGGSSGSAASMFA